MRIVLLSCLRFMWTRLILIMHNNMHIIITAVINNFNFQTSSHEQFLTQNILFSDHQSIGNREETCLRELSTFF